MRSTRTRRRVPWVLVVAIVGSAMSFIDGSAVNVVLPVVQRDLHASGTDMQWVVEGYALFVAALMLLGGALGDRYGRKRWFLIGVGVFGAASAACAFAPNVAALIVARSVQGIGAAASVPESLALISAVYLGAERGKAIGTWSGFASLTAAGGPVLGGWLAQHVSWRAVFFINVPLAVLVLIIGVLRVPESRDDDARGGLDVAGATLATAGLGALTYGLISLQGRAVDAVALAAAVLGAATLTAFIVVEARVRAPMMPPAVFRSRSFTIANLYTFALYGALGGSLYFVPFELIGVARYTATAAGASLLPFVVLQFGLARWSGGLVARIGARPPLVAGAVLAGVAFALFALADPSASYWRSFFAPAVVLGAAGVLFVSPLTTTVFDAIPVEHSGLASGINNAVSRCAALIAVAVLGILYAAIAPGGTADASPGSREHAFAAVMWTSAAICALAAVTALALPRRTTAVGCA